MKQIPKAIPELDGGLFLPSQVVDLLEVVLDDHGRMLDGRDGPAADKVVLDQLRALLRMTGPRPALAPAREQLGLVDPQQELMARNLLRG